MNPHPFLTFIVRNHQVSSRRKSWFRTLCSIPCVR